jgi:hypothetical protein
MTRTHSQIAAMLFALLAFTVPCFAGQKYAGHIHSVTESQLVLKVGTELMTFEINKDAAITLNGKAAKATDLKGEDEATLQAEKGDDSTLKATAIAATRAAAPALGQIKGIPR